MNTQLFLDQITNPALLFYILGIIAVCVKSDLEIPSNSSRFISLYLLFSIGFKGGQELAHSDFNWVIVMEVIYAMGISLIIPVYTFFILKKKFDIQTSGAVAAAYGSISAVTFVTAVSYLDILGKPFGGQMVALMALMEAPAIVAGLLLVRKYGNGKAKGQKGNTRKVITHAFTNGSVLLILGSLLIGWVASEEQAQGIAPFTDDIFKGFLAVFLLDMGIRSGRKIPDFIKNGWFAMLFAIIVPFINGVATAFISGYFIPLEGDRFLLSVLAASASYIAVPAAMKIANPESNEGIYLPMALAVTFPFNITFGLPLYMYIISA